jgi:hypothetical protein
MQLDSNAAPLPTPPATVYTGRSFSVMSDVDAALVDPRMYLLTEGECVGCGMGGAVLGSAAVGVAVRFYSLQVVVAGCECE